MSTIIFCCSVLNACFVIGLRLLLFLGLGETWYFPVDFRILGFFRFYCGRFITLFVIGNIFYVILRHSCLCFFCFALFSYQWLNTHLCKLSYNNLYLLLVANFSMFISSSDTAAFTVYKFCASAFALILNCRTQLFSWVSCSFNL